MLATRVAQTMNKIRAVQYNISACTHLSAAMRASKYYYWRLLGPRKLLVKIISPTHVIKTDTIWQCHKYIYNIFCVDVMRLILLDIYAATELLAAVLMASQIASRDAA